MPQNLSGGQNGLVTESQATVTTDQAFGGETSHQQASVTYCQPRLTPLNLDFLPAPRLGQYVHTTVYTLCYILNLSCLRTEYLDDLNVTILKLCPGPTPAALWRTMLERVSPTEHSATFGRIAATERFYLDRLRGNLMLWRTRGTNHKS